MEASAPEEERLLGVHVEPGKAAPPLVQAPRKIKSGKGLAEERHRTRGAHRVARALLRTLAVLMGGFLASALLASLRLAEVPKFKNRPIWMYFCPLWAAHGLSAALHLRALQLLRKYVARARRERVPFALTVLGRSLQWLFVGAALVATELLLYARFVADVNVRVAAVCGPAWALCALVAVRFGLCNGTPPATVVAAVLVALQGAALSWKLDGKTAFDEAAGSWFAVLTPTLLWCLLELFQLLRCLLLHRRATLEARAQAQKGAATWRVEPPRPRRLLDRRAKGAAQFYVLAFAFAAIAVVSGAVCLDERQRRREILVARLADGAIDRGKFVSLKRRATRVELDGRRVCAAAALASALCLARGVCVVALGLVRYYSRYIGQTEPLPLVRRDEGWDAVPDHDKFAVPWYLGVPVVDAAIGDA